MSTSTAPDSGYRWNVRALFRRWDPRGLLITDKQAHAAVALLRNPPSGDEAMAHERSRAELVCDAAVHPVLEQPIPSAFRVCSFMPITGLLSLGMISTHSPIATLLYHWLYQSHSAATRYCNYADTSRPLDARRMAVAYAASTGAAWAIALASIGLVHRVPRLRAVGMVVPHLAVASGGAISTVMNAEAELAEGVGVQDAVTGEELGVSRAAARATVERAVLLHGVLVPSCALLAPVLAMRTIVFPRLQRIATPAALWTSSMALVVGGVGVLTPFVAALVPPTVPLQPRDLEEELQPRLRDGSGAPRKLVSARRLY